MPRHNTSGYVPFDSIGTLCLIVSSRYLRVFKFDGQFQKQPIHLIFFWLDVHLPTLSFARASQHVATLTNSFRWSFTTLDREMRLLAYISHADLFNSYEISSPDEYISHLDAKSWPQKKTLTKRWEKCDSRRTFSLVHCSCWHIGGFVPPNALLVIAWLIVLLDPAGHLAFSLKIVHLLLVEVWFVLIFKCKLEERTLLYLRSHTSVWVHTSNWYAG